MKRVKKITLYALLAGVLITGSAIAVAKWAKGRRE
jgi:hypothetical protein